MDADDFDAVTQRLSGLLSRRRSLSVLAALGMSAGGIAGGDAKKKKKKKHKKTPPTTQVPTTPPPVPPCSRCGHCETCVNNTCQPKADGTACGDNHQCLDGVCSKYCSAFGQECAPTAKCFTTTGNGLTPFCGIDDIAECNQPVCATNADCSAGSVCAYRSCPGADFKAVCVVVANI